MPHRLLTIFTTATVALAARESHAQFVITDLGTLGGDQSRAYAINLRGDIVGVSDNAQGKSHAFLWRNNTMLDLGTLGGDQSLAFGINSLGVIVGSATVSTLDGRQRAFKYEAGSMLDLGDLGGQTSQAFAINDKDEITGSSDTNPTFQNPHGFFWKSGQLTDLLTFGGQLSSANGINDRSHVVGTAFLAGNAVNHAFLWRGDTLLDLGTLGGQRSTATAINLAGTIVGYSNPVASTADRAFIRLAGEDTLRALGTLGGTQSQALAINDGGTIVGWSTLAGDVVRHAWSSTGGALTNLNTLLPPGSGWILQEARGINNAGQIVGWGLHNGVVRAFRLSPVALVDAPEAPSPSGATLAGPTPHPIRTVARFSIGLPAGAHVRLALFDVAGRCFRVLDNGILPAGPTSVTWDGQDDQGVRVRPGVCFAVLEVAGVRIVRRVAVVQ